MASRARLQARVEAVLADSYASARVWHTDTRMNIRKFVLRAARLHDLVELGSLTAQAAEFLEGSVRAGLNLLVTGGTRLDSKPAV